MTIKEKENKKIGVVFLPVENAKKLCDEIPKSDWGNSIFFEPCCGIGNIVIVIVEKNFNAYFDKISKDKNAKDKRKSFANISSIQTIANLWAIDINPFFVKQTQDRVLNFLFKKIEYYQKLGMGLLDDQFKIFLKRGVKHHIHTNEMFSCIHKDFEKAKKESNKTRASREWFLKNKHKPIDFLKPWYK